jgi:hypothetical protein
MLEKINKAENRIFIEEKTNLKGINFCAKTPLLFCNKKSAELCSEKNSLQIKIKKSRR